MYTRNVVNMHGFAIFLKWRHQNMKVNQINNIVNCTSLNHMGRKVVIWGKSDYGDKTRLELKKQANIDVYCTVDSNKDLVDNYKIQSIDILRNNKEKFYVIIPLRYYKEITEFLGDSGYEHMSDYAYFAHEPIIVDKSQFTYGIYNDSYGNQIIGDIGNSKVILNGYNSKLIIGQGSMQNAEDIVITTDDGVDVEIGNNVYLGANTKWTFSTDSVFKIGDKCRLMERGVLKCLRGSKTTIGEGTSIGHSYRIIAHRNTSISIGKDCCISFYFHVRTNDGHSIFDLKTGKNINSLMEEQKSKKVVIYDHVWIGVDCLILYGAVIGPGSVVGAKSLVKKVYPNNCIIAGVPSKIVHMDIVWSRENNAENYESVEKQYIDFTNENDYI